MKSISMLIEREKQNLLIGEVIIEGGIDGDVMPIIPLVKNHTLDIHTTMTKWEVYDYQAFCGLIELYNDGDVNLYLVNSNQIYEAYKNNECLVYLKELNSTEEYTDFLENNI